MIGRGPHVILQPFRQSFPEQSRISPGLQTGGVHRPAGGTTDVSVGVGVGVPVVVGVGVGVTVRVGVGVGVGVDVEVGVSVSVAVGTGVSVSVGVGFNPGMSWQDDRTMLKSTTKHTANKDFLLIIPSRKTRSMWIK
jgi:hypothetical protein